MRDRHVCPKCKHNRFIVSHNIPDSANYIPVPMHVGRTDDEYVGQLQAIFCRRCGFVEFYVVDPASVPVDGRYLREVSGPESLGPFR